jgi:Fe-S cluster assembly ATPase SufC
MTLGMQDTGLDVNRANGIVSSVEWLTRFDDGMMMIVKEKRLMVMEDNE